MIIFIIVKQFLRFSFKFNQEIYLIIIIKFYEDLIYP
jgi:hypothetical protein